MLRLAVHWLMAFAVVAFFASTAHAQAAAAQPVGRIIVAKVTGEVFASGADMNVRFPLRNGSLLAEGQIISTGPNATVLLVLQNGATVMVGADAKLSVESFTMEPFAESFKVGEIVAEPSSSKTRLNLMRGEIMSEVKKLNKGAGSQFSIKTPVGAAGIRGTAFRLSFRTEGNRASYRLEMADGTIEQEFSSRTRPVTVTQNKQIALTGLDYDPNTGEVSGIPSVVEVSDIPTSTLALLQQIIQQMNDALSNLSIPGSPNGAAGVQTANPAGNDPAGAQTASPNAQPPVSASPQAQVPAPSVSPTAGKNPS